MSKFKVGDKIRLVDYDADSEDKAHSGEVAVITSRTNMSWHYSFDDGCWNVESNEDNMILVSEEEETEEEEDEDVIYPESEDKTLPSTKPDTHQYFPTAKQIKGYVKT